MIQSKLKFPLHLSSPQVLSCPRAVNCHHPGVQTGGHCRAPRPLRSLGLEFSWRCKRSGSSLTSWAQKWLLPKLEGGCSQHSRCKSLGWILLLNMSCSWTSFLLTIKDTDMPSTAHPGWCQGEQMLQPQAGCISTQTHLPLGLSGWSRLYPLILSSSPITCWMTTDMSVDVFNVTPALQRSRELKKKSTMFWFPFHIKCPL